MLPWHAFSWELTLTESYVLDNPGSGSSLDGSLFRDISLVPRGYSWMGRKVTTEWLSEERWLLNDCLKKGDYWMTVWRKVTTEWLSEERWLLNDCLMGRKVTTEWLSDGKKGDYWMTVWRKVTTEWLSDQVDTCSESFPLDWEWD